MSATADYYAVLGIQREASPDEIRTAYRKAARASHPDLHPEDATAPDRFKQVQVAYEILGDPARRAAYDTPAPRPVSYAPRPYDPDEPVSLARELGETVRAIRVMARRSGFARRVNRLIRYLERL
jgi:curved DNA-binding protein CbpA